MFRPLCRQGYHGVKQREGRGVGELTMRTVVMAAAALAGLGLATPAMAQRVWQDGRWVVLPPPGTPPATVDADRWGPVVNGRWEAATRAPGGWAAYRRPARGATLPGYWRDERFRVVDYLAFGLPVPPRGYFWVRYYDDAVLVDAGGHVWDSVGGVAWHGSALAAASLDQGQAQAQAWGDGPGARYAPPPAPGAIQTIDPDRHHHRGDARLAPEPGYDRAPPPPPPAGGYAPSAVGGPPMVQVYSTPACVQACPAAGAYGYGYGGAYAQSYYAGGYAYGGATTTVIVSAPVVTTTVEEIVTTTYVRSTPRRAVRRAAVRPRPKPVVQCCVCGCR
jgi:Ni/Co efflux regulator RcnB